MTSNHAFNMMKLLYTLAGDVDPTSPGCMNNVEIKSVVMIGPPGIKPIIWIWMNITRSHPDKTMSAVLIIIISYYAQATEHGLWK